MAVLRAALEPMLSAVSSYAIWTIQLPDGLGSVLSARASRTSPTAPRRPPNLKRSLLFLSISLDSFPKYLVRTLTIDGFRRCEFARPVIDPDLAQEHVIDVGVVPLGRPMPARA